ncbi:MAG: hypothetical protein WCQ94_05080 [Lachnospiraceae bacterium]|jgi:hypothetical protein|nr:hypothetical protein [Lachnospiraceae bacterium]MDD4526364.1 hypothetical protein [Lachnospiraceae bacterium]
MIENFMASLKVMGLGMIGIFAVAIALIIVMKLLTTIFPGSGKKNKKTDDSISE